MTVWGEGMQALGRRPLENEADASAYRWCLGFRELLWSTMRNCEGQESFLLKQIFYSGLHVVVGSTKGSVSPTLGSQL